MNNTKTDISRHLLNVVDSMNEKDLRALNTEVVRLIKAFRATKVAVAKTKFTYGSKVSFNVKRRGYSLTGTIVKINRTTAQVQTAENGMWKVGLSLLEVVK